ncbi:MAG: futalosine hydrolase [Saprospiraceae bacterium]|nr:futalosine hydrolase [Saprospiraceae bacterium]
MHILLVAATPFEIAPLLQWLENNFEQTSPGHFVTPNLQVSILISGVGGSATAGQTARFLALQPINWAINAGIAGAFDPSLAIGSVVQVASERWGDLGVEEADGGFTDLAELGFTPQNYWQNPAPHLPGLPAVKGLTVNKVHGNEASILLTKKKYPDVQTESMEGAAFFQACLDAGTPFVEIRSISNRVEPRNREAWDIPQAIRELNLHLIGMLETLMQ